MMSFYVCQVSTTVETFQDLSLPIPGKEDLAKLHSSIHQNLPVKTGVCPDTYNSQGWITYIMDSIRRSVALVCSGEIRKSIFCLVLFGFVWFLTEMSVKQTVVIRRRGAA